LSHQRDWRLAEASHRQALAAKQWQNFPSTARRCPSPAMRLAAVAPGGDGLLRLALPLCR